MTCLQCKVVSDLLFRQFPKGRFVTTCPLDLTSLEFFQTRHSDDANLYGFLSHLTFETLLQSQECGVDCVL